MHSNNSNKINPNKSNMNKSISSYSVLRNVVTIIVFLLSMQSEMFAQQAGSPRVSTIKLLDTYVGGGTDPDRTRLKELVYEVQSSVYFYDNVVKTYGNTPVSLFTDFNGFIRLPQATFQKETIELLTIRIDNPTQIISTLNLSTLSAFTKLKYIYILTSFPYTLQQISQVVTSSNTNYIVVYKSDMGS